MLGREVEHVVLVGLMASGKTSVGRLLAARLGRPFVDNDVMLERLAGRPARDIADQDGAAALHRLEAEALVAAIAAPDPAVIAAAAGAVLEPGAAPALRSCFVVYLRAAPSVLEARIAAEADDGHRPHFDLAAQFRTRDPRYVQLATVVVDAASSVDAVVEQIISARSAPRAPSSPA